MMMEENIRKKYASDAIPSMQVRSFTSYLHESLLKLKSKHLLITLEHHLVAENFVSGCDS